MAIRVSTSMNKTSFEEVGKESSSSITCNEENCGCCEKGHIVGSQHAGMQHARQELPHASQELELAIAKVEYEYEGRHKEAAVKIQSTFRGGQEREALAAAVWWRPTPRKKIECRHVC